MSHILKGASPSGRNGKRGMAMKMSGSKAVQAAAAVRGSLLSSATSPASASSACQGIVTGPACSSKQVNRVERVTPAKKEETEKYMTGGK